MTALLASSTGVFAQTCGRNLTANVVALDQVFFWNRLGAVQPQGMMFALRRDVVSSDGSATLTAGNVQLRPGKRPRPLVLRMNAGDCLTINFQNLLDPTRTDRDQAATRMASIHVNGLQLKNSIASDGSYAGGNSSSLVAPGQSATYIVTATREGEHLLYSLGAAAGGEGDGGQINAGLFGAVIVEPQGSFWYRSQVTEEELRTASTYTPGNDYPKIDYSVLNMLNNGEIVYSDLTAIIAGSGANTNGNFAAGEFPANTYTYPRRKEAFREFVTLYHDETGAVQAFQEFYDPVLKHTLHSVRDGFAINYGSAGAGAEILANRFGVGPMWKCPECKYEEFFLSSWAVGDPAMVVDVPANSPCTPDLTEPNAANTNASVFTKANALRDQQPCTPTAGRKATKAFFPDDPSNVYHSYLRDHVKFRVLHAGSKEHHIHHLHAHQWLYSPDNDKSSYLDSQAIGPGASFTAEIAHDGSGNLNQTVGDSIFHCHFYPHFAQGMWALWRVHDVLEKGTVMDPATGKPATGSRALPDGEIYSGTPIPAVVPLPAKAMAPLPTAGVSINGGQNGGQVVITGTGNPGYPFFVPAKAGNRPPHPPMDIAVDPVTGESMDGGLPRHRINRAYDPAPGDVTESHTRRDFRKVLNAIKVIGIPENGDPTEQAAMAFHAQREHPTCRPDGVCDSATTSVKFITNGMPAVQGAPFADPCIDANGNPVSTAANPRVYKAAAIQTDVTFNKAGWHTPQQRFFALWEDVNAFLTPGGKPPEPMFLRANSGDCVKYLFTNLVPHEYKQDDFQVRTPTDVLGQHIHLVKFDVLASDGAGNGFNYEDGSFSPGEVRERINAIRAANACTTPDSRDGTLTCPLPKVHPFFGAGPGGDWKGAQTTVQRWYADPVQDNAGNDRTLRTVFTHDHFGPSTHQQTGLYAGLVVEPAGAAWVHNETGVPLGTGRSDGGPTSWQAVIDPPNEPDYREFLLAFNDDQPAYPQEATSYPNAPLAINPPVKNEVELAVSNDLLQRATSCPGNVAAPCPEAVTAADIGTMTVNYRNEPVALRVFDPATQTQAASTLGDLSYPFSSRVNRVDARLNVQPTFYQPLTNSLLDKDPYTPLLRAYENDRVQIRVLVGGHEEGHNFSVHGIKWLQEPSNPDSGYRNSQMMGISEHFEFIVPQLVKNPQGSSVDRLWSAGSSTDDLWNGLWGLFRAYTGKRADLAALPDNPEGRANIDPSAVGNFDFSCPHGAVEHVFNVSAITARSLANHGYGSKLVYNERTDGAFGALFDSTASLYVQDQDLDLTVSPPQLKTTARIEPLVLRARAGECVVVNLTNRMGNRTIVDGYNTLPMLIDGFNANDLKPSSYAGLHPQMLYYDPSRYDGIGVGNNVGSTQVTAAGETVTYKWYAGDIKVNPDGSVTATPIEFGATNLISSDRILGASKGSIGALIIEPADATWLEDAVSKTLPNNTVVSQTVRASATVTTPAGSFREFVLQFQNDINLRMGAITTSGEPVKNLGGEEDPEDSGQKAINYRSEPLWKRMQHAPETPFTSVDVPPGTSVTPTVDLTDWDDVVSNAKVGGADPQTPVFAARAGQAVRFRLLQSGGHSRNVVFGLHGHVWDRQPFLNGSTQIGQNTFSFWEGAHMGHGPTNHADLLLRNGAGGEFHITGDYLFRDLTGPGFDNGLWGLLRVSP
ncbi:MAG TPA: multicopper oxidase domain-containing protein [Thermoanaerobaculia bacterium]|nr:multicopper oxidase domain-containing protein [Thermoanaerobaculia bacterium]